MNIEEVNRMHQIGHFRYPLVSYIIPCYNKEPYLLDCISSVTHQEYPNIEIIFIDDGSTDGSLNLAKSLLRYQNARIISHDINRGLGQTLYEGYRVATGEFLCFLSADDCLIDIYKTIRQVGIMEVDTDTDITFFDGFRAGISLKESTPITISGIHRLLLLNRPLLFLYIAKCNNFIGSLSLMHRRSSYFRLGEWDETLRNCNDHDLILGQIIKGARIRMLDGNFVFYRDSDTQLSKDAKFWDTEKIIRMKWKNRIKSIPGFGLISRML